MKIIPGDYGSQYCIDSRLKDHVKILKDGKISFVLHIDDFKICFHYLVSDLKRQSHLWGFPIFVRCTNFLLGLLSHRVGKKPV